MDPHPFMLIHPLIPMIELFQNLTFKIQGQSHSSRSHNRYTILSPHIPFILCWSATPFLRCSYQKHWPSKSKVKVMGDVTVQSHNASLTSYWLTSLSFHVNSASHCWVMTYPNLTFKFKGQGQGWGHSSNSQCGCNILSTHIHVDPPPPVPEIQHFQNLTRL